MPRMPRVFVENSLYYVTCKSLPNQRIFREKGDYDMYFGLMKKYKEQYGVQIYAYNLMPSHLHILMEVDEKTTISTIMHNINSTYTKFYNNRYHRKGHLFRERFKTAFIEKDKDLLLNLSAYMHLNAKKLEFAMTAESYPYSSYSLYLDYDLHDDHGLNMKDEINEILTGLINENYADYLNRAGNEFDFKKMHNKLQRKKILGSEDFIKKVKEEIEHKQSINESENIISVPVEGNKLLTKAGAAVLIVTLTVGGLFLYFNFSNKEIANINNEKSFIVNSKLDHLDSTEWQIRIVNRDGTKVDNDIISFHKGKFSSAYLNKSGYPQINYSVALEGNKMIWETMQTSPKGTASWRGEIEDGKMTGILSLREAGKQPQDFSFKSLKYRRK